MQEKRGRELKKTGFPEGSSIDRPSRGWDWRFTAEVVAAVLSPLVGPLGLWLHPPASDAGQLFSFLGWPMLYFLAGLFASGFDQPRYGDGGDDDMLTRLKGTAHDLRVAWLFFLLLFEGLAAMWILSEYQWILLPFVLAAYTAYASLAVSWLVWKKRIRGSGGPDAGTKLEMH